MDNKQFYYEIKPKESDGGFFLLFVIFAILKLIGVIDQSWWWVTAPLWIPVAFYFALLISYTVVWLILKLLLLFRK